MSFSVAPISKACKNDSRETVRTGAASDELKAGTECLATAQYYLQKK